MSLSDTLAALKERLQMRVDGRPPSIPDLRPPTLDGLDRHRTLASEWDSLVGAVNPRPGGPLNAVAQGLKRILARMLRWYSFPQRQFNAQAVAAMAETRHVFAEVNRNLVVLAQVSEQLQRGLRELRGEFEGWQTRSSAEAAETARSLEGRIVSNVSLLEANDRDLRRAISESYENLNAALNQMQQTLWSALEAQHDEYASRYGDELRRIRHQMRLLSAGLASPEPVPASAHRAPILSGSPASAVSPLSFDYPLFEERFRGPEEEIRDVDPVVLARALHE